MPDDPESTRPAQEDRPASTHDLAPSPAAKFTGPPRFGWFGGILEGHVGDRDSLKRAAAALNGVGAAAAHLEIDGGRFSILFDDEPRTGDHFLEERLSDLVDALQTIVNAAREPQRVESTLRCTVVFDERVSEILFAPIAGEIRAVARARARREDDRRFPTAANDRLSALRDPRGRVLVGLFVLLGALMIWNGGARDYALSPSADALTRDPGPFAGLIDLTVTRGWPGYVVTLRRGPDFPLTPRDSAALEAAADTNVRLAAVRAVSQGGEIQVRISSAEGILLRAGVCSLRGLLTGGDPVETKLPGHRDSTTVELSLD